jgi:GrpB-like predicted nucleotidyltransferase (UPF0157 family)/GNAT superfamily N-acetyltransferase
VPALLAIIHAAYEEYRGRLDPPSGSHGETPASLQALLEAESAFIAGLGEQPAGCVFFHLQPQETYLHRLAVRPEFRGLAIGRGLVNAVEAAAWAAGSPQLRLGVRLQLPANQAYYERLGFTVLRLGSHPGYTRPTFAQMVKDVSVPPVRRVEVSPPDPEWPAEFRREARLLALVLGEELVAIHHVGSTAVPGIYAKPIVDILPVVRAIERVDVLNGLMSILGYEPLGEYGIAGRRYFPKGARTRRSHHVHIYQAGNPEIARHLAFRNYLIAHPQEAQAYSNLKRSLAAAHPADIDAYVEGKDPLIKSLEAGALVWYH